MLLPEKCCQIPFIWLKSTNNDTSSQNFVDAEARLCTVPIIYLNLVK